MFSYSPEKAWGILPGATTPPFEDTFSIFAYKDPRVKNLVWNIKYKKSREAVAIGGYALCRMLQTEIGISNKDARAMMIIPMPITPRRLRERGFNQCDLLADEVAKLDSKHQFMIEKNLLARVHHDSRQTLKSRGERLLSAKGIFAVNENFIEGLRIERLKDYSLIVIDDVITTGSTMKEAMETLRKAGFTNVTGLSLAH